LQVGDQIQLSVIEPYTPNSDYAYPANVPPGPSCDDGLDLAAGETLDATIVTLQGDAEQGCLSGGASFGPVGGWTWQPITANPQDGDNGYLLWGSYNATRGQCAGVVHIQATGDATPFVPPVVGQIPHVVFLRSFQANAPTNPACPPVVTSASDGICNGIFVVSAKKL
jgi:hypothetical protein